MSLHENVADCFRDANRYRSALERIAEMAEAGGVDLYDIHEIASKALGPALETCAHQHPDRKPDDTYCRDCGEHF